jgi:hypothetical protein
MANTIELTLPVVPELAGTFMGSHAFVGGPFIAPLIEDYFLDMDVKYRYTLLSRVIGCGGSPIFCIARTLHRLKATFGPAPKRQPP